MSERDNCSMCRGARGGVPGNENIINGVVLCDYCHADPLCSMCEWIKTAGLHPQYAQDRIEGPGHDTHCKRGRP